MWETWVQSLSQEDPQEKGVATHSSILAGRTPWTEEPGELQSMESQRVGHNWATNTHRHTHTHTHRGLMVEENRQALNTCLKTHFTSICKWITKFTFFPCQVAECLPLLPKLAAKLLAPSEIHSHPHPLRGRLHHAYLIGPQARSKAPETIFS